MVTGASLVVAIAAQLLVDRRVLLEVAAAAYLLTALVFGLLHRLDNDGDVAFITFYGER